MRVDRSENNWSVSISWTSGTEHREIFSEYHLLKPNLDCNYTFLIDFEPNEISFSSKSIVEVYLQSKFGLD